MGINGLIPFLKKATRPVTIRELSGNTAAVDTYCLIHRGAFSCAEQIGLGQKCDGHVRFVVKYVEMLLSSGIKPIMVFDGANLPSKAETERDRKKKREEYRKRACHFLREGRRDEAIENFRRCVDVTPEMAKEVLDACLQRGVDCLVAPFEADAQMAFLNRAGIAQLVITEDSDLILFGCEKIVFKLRLDGSGVLLCQQQLSNVPAYRDMSSFDRFRWMCILSGCDYVPRLPGIGLSRAHRVLRSAGQVDLDGFLSRLPKLLHLPQADGEYVSAFRRAENTFLHQLVFDPLTSRLRPLSDYPHGTTVLDFPYAGSPMDDEAALQWALGNVDVHTRQTVDHFDPARWKCSTPRGCASSPRWNSIWTTASQQSSHHSKNTFPPQAKPTASRPLTHRQGNVLLRPAKRKATDECDAVGQDVLQLYPGVDSSFSPSTSSSLCSLFSQSSSTTTTVSLSQESSASLLSTPPSSSPNLFRKRSSPERISRFFTPSPSSSSSSSSSTRPFKPPAFHKPRGPVLRVQEEKEEPECQIISLLDPDMYLENAPLLAAPAPPQPAPPALSSSRQTVCTKKRLLSAAVPPGKTRLPSDQSKMTSFFRQFEFSSQRDVFQH